jgi:thioredoxin-dependent peroxiredoxin
VADNRAFAEKFNYNFPLLCDERREIGTAYGACETPDAEYAKRISYVISPAGKIERVYGHVDPPKHPAEVLADLKSEQTKQAP